MKKTLLLVLVIMLMIAPVCHAKTLKQTLHSLTIVGMADTIGAVANGTIKFALSALAFPFKLGERISYFR